jgi:hypothetical protein
MLKHSIWLSAAGALLVAAACSSSSSGGNGAPKGAAGASSEGGTGGDGTSTASVADYCSQACAAEHDCDKSHDVKTCYSDCKDSLAAAGPNLRSDFLASITACIPMQDCASVLDHTALSECRDEAVAQLTPSKEGTSFCNDFADTASKCGGEFSKAACLNQAKTFTDDALQAAEECLGKSCSKIAACVDAALGKVGSDNTGAGGATGAGGEPATGGTLSTGGIPGIGTGAAGEAGAGGAPDLTPYTGSCTDATSPSKCTSATELNFCVSNKYEIETCTEFLSALGFTGSACKGTSCQIETATDTTCQQGVTNLCACQTCTDNDTLNYYVACHTDDPAGTRAAFQCMAKAADCVAVNACIPAM